MLGFWEREMRDRKLFEYSLAPFLEAASILLYGASGLWHPWSLRRKKELSEAAFTLKNRAEYVRTCGLGWACNSNMFSDTAAGLLGGSAHHRYRSEKDISSSPEGAAMLAGAALQLVTLMVPTLKKMRERSHGESRWLEHAYGIIETLMESPCLASRPVFTDHALHTVGVHAVLLECEGLAYTQARIEDNLASKGRRKDRAHKKSDLSDAELKKLAEEMDMPFQTVKEVFETEYSSWWLESEKFRLAANREKERFLKEIELDDMTTNAMRAVWEPGMASAHDPSCWNEDDCRRSEQIVRALIGMFLSPLENERPEKFHAMLKASPKKLTT